MRRIAVLLVATLLAGCIGGLDESATDRLDDPTGFEEVGEPLLQSHDGHDYEEGHAVGPLHEGSANVEVVEWLHPIGEDELGEVGFAGVTIWDHYAFLATDGKRGGFVVIDIEDPTEPEVIGRYATDAAASQDPKVSPDGNWLFLHVQDPAEPSEMTDAEGARDGGLGIQIVDISDKSNPDFEAFYPVELYGSHNTYPYRYESGPMAGETFLFHTGQPLLAPPGDYVIVSRFAVVDGEPTLTRVAQFTPEGAWTDPGAFPHDMYVFEHPGTGQVLLYAAYWNGGAVVADVTDPLTPEQIGAYDDPAPSAVNNVHSFLPYKSVDGTHYSFSTPEIGSVEGETGLLRVYDTTEPGAIDQVGHWTLPGDLEIRSDYRFSPHNFGMHPTEPLVALAHYHAGVWILDVSDPADPEATGYHLPNGDETGPYDDPFWHKQPNFDPHGFIPATYDARWYRGYLIVSDRSTGFYVLEYTGPGAPEVGVDPVEPDQVRPLNPGSLEAS